MVDGVCFNNLSCISSLWLRHTWWSVYVLTISLVSHHCNYVIQLVGVSFNNLSGISSLWLRHTGWSVYVLTISIVSHHCDYVIQFGRCIFLQSLLYLIIVITAYRVVGVSFNNLSCISSLWLRHTWWTAYVLTISLVSHHCNYVIQLVGVSFNNLSGISSLWLRHTGWSVYLLTSPIVSHHCDYVIQGGRCIF